MTAQHASSAMALMWNKYRSESSKPTAPLVVRRDDIPAITHVTIDGIDRYIGEVRDFRGNDALRDFIPNEGRSSLSWVRLAAGEVHHIHTHPTASMVIICEGGGKLIGDTQRPVEAGDMVIIPSNALHGFIAGENSGLRGLSIQFDGLGLYENAAKPRMQSGTEDPFKPVVDAQTVHVEQYGYNRLVELVKTNAIRDDQRLKACLLDVLQVWSDHFQKLIRIRSAAARAPEFCVLADQHMIEEFGHNEILAELRGNHPVDIWDPTLESTAAWFAERMARGSDTDTTILMHLVIEEAGDVFHRYGARVFPDAKHFEVHGVLDDDHAEMGLEVLRQHSPEPVEHMVRVLEQGWAMMNILCNRMADVAIANARRTGARENAASCSPLVPQVRTCPMIVTTSCREGAVIHQNAAELWRKHLA